MSAFVKGYVLKHNFKVNVKENGGILELNLQDSCEDAIKFKQILRKSLANLKKIAKDASERKPAEKNAGKTRELKKQLSPVITKDSMKDRSYQFWFNLVHRVLHFRT